jgi:hypothetical protein
MQWVLSGGPYTVASQARHATLCVRRRAPGTPGDLRGPGRGRAGGRWGSAPWVIHFPAVVCTSSPSTTNRLGVRTGVDPQRTTQGLDAVPVGISGGVPGFGRVGQRARSGQSRSARPAKSSSKANDVVTLIGERVSAVLVVPAAVFPGLDVRHPLPTCAPTEISIHCVGVSGPSNAAALHSSLY